MLFKSPFKWSEYPRLRQIAKRIVRFNPAVFFPTWLASRLLLRSQLFDFAWYAERTGVSTISPLNAARALIVGEGDGRSANPMFDADWYRHRYGVGGSVATLLLHYRWIGEPLGLQPSAWFQPRYFRRRYGLPIWPRSALATYMREWPRWPVGHPMFDVEWYRATYPDVARAGTDPLLHFAIHGAREGRLPNAYMDPIWYLGAYRDVAAAGLDPVLHYFTHGAFEYRDPGPNFQARYYHDRYGDQIEPGSTPLAHYLSIGREAGHTIDPPAIEISALVENAPAPESIATSRDDASPVGAVDVIVPVYRGLEETRTCIESVLSSRNRGAIRIRVYNDASPEPAVTDYLRALAAREPRIQLSENERNLGFVGTVNQAMRAALAEPDCIGVLLLNSDTEVCGDWVDRMRAHAASDARCASVTALSNNATICSYPRPGDHPMPKGVSLAALDAAATTVNRGRSVEIPTAVGFCMYIARGALETVGLFDEDAFGKGYGEENDFCLRARALGYRHLLALDTFVYHRGEVSFADASKPGKLIAEKIIAARYPDYAAQVADWVRRDPASIGRLRLTAALWRMDAATHALVAHGLGGGTERHVQESARDAAGAGHALILRPVVGRPDRLRIENLSEADSFCLEVRVADGLEFAELLRAFGVVRVHVHHVLGYSTALREGLAIAGLPFDFFVHDFFTVCPQITFTTADGRYCGEPTAAVCDACIRERPSHGATDIRNWRAMYEWPALGAERVIAPSRDCAARIDRYFGVLPDVAYHEPKPSIPPPPSRKPRSRLRVAVLGVLAPHKGRAAILACATLAYRDALPIEFHLIGDAQGEPPDGIGDRFRASGWYREEDLDRKIVETDPDVLLFASQAPETYSYTLTAAMRSGRPIAAIALGAFRERLEDYPHAWIFPAETLPEDLVRQLIARFGREPIEEVRSDV
jgi:GT2 family glycosyltransferase/glycosyltransferase involved in cell wall biosynthesis